MFYKVIGAAAVTISAYLIGLMYSHSLDAYAKLMGDTAKLIGYMKSEAAIHVTPLNEIVKKIFHSFDTRDITLFMSAQRYIEQGELFSKAFSLAVAENKTLRGEDKSLLTEFANGVCVCPMSNLSEYFDGYIDILEERAQAAKEEAEKKGKLLKSVSVLVGAFTAVLLL